MQRAILKVISSMETQEARDIVDKNVASLNTTKWSKQSQTAMRWSGIRGKLLTSPAELKDIGRHETLYIVGHGNGWRVGGMTPAALASVLDANLPEDYNGAIKLVSCYSARGVFYQVHDDLREELKRRGRDLPVQGIKQAAYVDPITGRIVGVDEATRTRDLELRKTNRQLSDELTDLKKAHGTTTSQWPSPALSRLFEIENELATVNTQVKGLRASYNYGAAAKSWKK
ncbi:MAG TPA: hypothetical protein VKE51_20590 [Vicinamibacterales bacterium]|nr:hypothetical protein [Vicinamibacterales bacterium]